MGNNCLSRSLQEMGFVAFIGADKSNINPKCVQLQKWWCSFQGILMVVFKFWEAIIQFYLVPEKSEIECWA